MCPNPETDGKRAAGNMPWGIASNHSGSNVGSVFEYQLGTLTTIVHVDNKQDTLIAPELMTLDTHRLYSYSQGRQRTYCTHTFGDTRDILTIPITSGDTLTIPILSGDTVNILHPYL